MPATRDGHLPIRDLIKGHRVRRPAAGAAEEHPAHRWNETLSSAAVILAGVVLVIGFGFVASRAMRSPGAPPSVSLPQGPALGEVTIPPGPADQGLIPLTSPSAAPSATPPSSAPPSLPASSAPTLGGAVTTTAPPADQGALTIALGSVPSGVDLATEGTVDWVHWGEQSTFSLERDKKGGFAILEGAPVAPRFRHALSPQKFSWIGGDPIAQILGTPTGIRTCGTGNGFTLSAPAGITTRTLRLYVGAVDAKGQLTANLSTGSASASATLDQNSGAIKTAVLTLTYHAPKDGKINIRWNTVTAYGKGCGGVTLEAATLR